MALVSMTVIANVPAVDDASALAAEFVYALRERNGASIYDATLVVAAEGGDRFNLEEMAAGLGGGD